jgi:hypothetical protein
MLIRKELLDQPDEFINPDSCLPDNGPQCAAIQFFVVRNNYLTKRLVTTKDYVAPFLSFEMKARTFQSLYALTSRYSG